MESFVDIIEGIENELFLLTAALTNPVEENQNLLIFFWKLLAHVG
jgi:hypothetical protein